MVSWHWTTDVRGRSREIGDMLAASVADEGILGYAQEPSAAQRQGFVDALAQACDDGSGHVLIGEDAEGVVAMCVMKTTSMPNCRHIADVQKAYLSPRVRGTSAVYQLVEQVCEKADALGVELFTIDVREDSKAHRVWARFGFTSYGVLDDYARVEGTSYRGHFMHHRVSDLAAAVRDRVPRARAAQS